MNNCIVLMFPEERKKKKKCSLFELVIQRFQIRMISIHMQQESSINKIMKTPVLLVVRHHHCLLQMIFLENRL